MELGIDHPNDSQLKDCWGKLDKLKEGEVVKTKDHAPNKPKLWIKCCQMYHDVNKCLKFKSDYTEITKTERELEFKEQIFKTNER